MTAIILTLHTLIVLGLIVVVLLQRSDGGALGLGGGGGGGFMTGRGAANALTRTTSGLAAIFFATSIGLAILAGGGEDETSIIDDLTGQTAPAPSSAPGEMSTEDLLNTLGGGNEDTAPAAAGETAPDLDSVLDSLGTEGALGSPTPDQEADGEENSPEQPQ
ncbi:MAG: preprotein translocase subunit SecG [Pseudomonadota bacterium]